MTESQKAFEAYMTQQKTWGRNEWDLVWPIWQAAVRWSFESTPAERSARAKEAKS